MADELDCQACGACCVNLPANREEGFSWWVPVAPDDELLDREDLVTEHVIRDPEGVPHLRLAPDGRCLALHGAVGHRVRCTIYRHRPRACHNVEPGDELCQRYRQAHGLTDEA